MGSSDELVAKLRGGSAGNYDVISPSSDVATMISRAGLATPLDLTKIPTYTQLSSQLRALPLVKIEGKTFGVPSLIEGAGGFRWPLISIRILDREVRNLSVDFKAYSGFVPTPPNRRGVQGSAHRAMRFLPSTVRGPADSRASARFAASGAGVRVGRWRKDIIHCTHSEMRLWRLVRPMRHYFLSSV
jgi:hypothetical protein